MQLTNFHQIWPFCALLFVLTFVPDRVTADDDSVCLDQDEWWCDARNWAEEFACLREKKSLDAALLCVTKDENDEVENQICREDDAVSTYDYLVNKDSPDFKYYKHDKEKKQWCTSPRSLIVETYKLMNPILKLDIGILGQLRACPREKEKDYHDCLCMGRVTSTHLGVIADHFIEPNISRLRCNFEKKAASLQSRELLEEEMHGFPVVINEKEERSFEARADDNNQPRLLSVNKDGRPVYKTPGSSKPHTARHPLPYFYDSIWEDEAIRRCFVHPTLAAAIACTTWMIPPGYSVTLSTGRPTLAVYTSGYEDDPPRPSIISLSTRSTPPPIASGPSSSYSYSHRTAQQISAPTATPTPTSTSTAPIVAPVSVWQVLAPLIVLVPIL